MDKIPSWLLKLIAGLAAILLIALIVDQSYAIKGKVQVVDDKHIVTISAQGKITAKPDLLEVSAGVVTNAGTALDAHQQNTAKMNKVIDFVKSQGVDSADIQTSNYSIYPTYDYTGGKQVITGYSANQTITIKVHNFDIAGPLLDGLSQNGANQIENVNYTFADPDALREQAREQALASAKDKAQRLAKAAGVQLGELVTFTEDQSQAPYPIPYAAAVGKGGAPDSAPVTQVEPGTQDITAQVTVTYSLK